MKIFRLLIVIVSVLSAETVFAKDVTALVIQHTNLDEKIVAACSKHCKGNRRGGRLTKATIRRESQSGHIIDIWASLKNHHHVNTVLGGGFAAYQYTIGVHATGRLNQNNCKITIINISLSNDKIGLGSGARKEVGKVYDVANCGLFI